MYQELKHLRNGPSRQNYNFEASDLPVMDYEAKHFVTVHEQHVSNQDMVLLDSFNSYNP